MEKKNIYNQIINKLHVYPAAPRPTPEWPHQPHKKHPHPLRSNPINGFVNIFCVSSFVAMYYVVCSFNIIFLCIARTCKGVMAYYYYCQAIFSDPNNQTNVFKDPK